MIIEKHKVQTVFAVFDSIYGKQEHVTVTEWFNGEGFDVSVNDDQLFSLTWDQFDALKKCVKKL